MTEPEWLSCEDTRPMLSFLRDRATGRKLRLFAVACCHRIWPLITDDVGRQAVDLAERLADGESAPANLAEFIDYVHYKGFSYIDGFPKERNLRIASHAVYAAYNALPDVLPPDAIFDPLLRPRLAQTPVEAAWAVAESWRRGDEEERDVADFHRELKAQTPLLRDVFGPLPFRAVTVNPSWRAWDGGTVVQIATSVYADRAFHRLGILADALEDAGCSNAEILAHLRGPGPHVRGCWALDLVLGKE